MMRLFRLLRVPLSTLFLALAAQAASFCQPPPMGSGNFEVSILYSGFAAGQITSDPGADLRFPQNKVYSDSTMVWANDPAWRIWAGQKIRRFRGL